MVNFEKPYTYEAAVELWNGIKRNKRLRDQAIKNGWVPEDQKFLSSKVLYRLWQCRDCKMEIHTDEMYIILADVFKTVAEAKKAANRASAAADHAASEAIWAGYDGR